MNLIFTFPFLKIRTELWKSLFKKDILGCDIMLANFSFNFQVIFLIIKKD